MSELPNLRAIPTPDRRPPKFEREQTERPLAAISAIEGKALILKDREIYLLDVETGGNAEPQLLSKEEARALNLHADPRLLQIHDVGDYPFPEVFELLHEAWLIDRIRVFALSALDPQLEPAMRAEAASFVEEYLDDPDIVDDLRELLQGPELPADADFKNAPATGRFGELLAEVQGETPPPEALVAAK